MDAALEAQKYSFRDFELDLGARQLRLHGEPVRIERRPLDLLILLVTRHGLLVSREEIIKRLWPANVVIEFDTGLNTLVRKVRQALRDSREDPVFIETAAGLGYRFIAPVTEQATSVAAAVAHRGSSRTSIAVLPFANLTQDDGLNYLAAGLAEDTSASLGQVDPSSLRLIGQVSGRAFTASYKTTQQIGRELGVDFVVASSLRAEHGKVRVTSRLLRVADSVQVWTASFDRELTSVLGLQRELSVAIAEQVRLQLSPEVTAAMARRQTPNPEAYDLYLRGRYMWGLLSPASNRRALEYFERAIIEDATYALAWAGIAQVLSTAPVTGDAEPASVCLRARDAVEHAVRYGAGLTEAQYALGYINFWLNWDWPVAEAALRSAVLLDPNNAIAHLMLGHVLSQSGDQVEARAMMRRARELDPFFSHTFALSSQIAFQARDYASALELARQAIAINPEAWVGHLQLGQALSELSEHGDAIEAFDSAERLSGGNSKSIAFRAHVLAKTGRADDARAVIAALRAKSNERFVPPYVVAIIHAGLSDHEAALEWLERAYSVRDVHLAFLPVDPRWDDLRDHPSFRSLLGRCQFLRSGSLRNDH